VQTAIREIGYKLTVIAPVLITAIFLLPLVTTVIVTAPLPTEAKIR